MCQMIKKVWNVIWNVILLTLHDTYLVDLISGYLVPADASRYRPCVGLCNFLSVIVGIFRSVPVETDRCRCRLVPTVQPNSRRARNAVIKMLLQRFL